MSRLDLDVSDREEGEAEGGFLREIVIKVRKMPRYKKGWLRCTRCGLSFRPNQPLPSFVVCPYCGTKLRAHARTVKREKKVKRIGVKGDEAEGERCRENGA